MTRRPDIINKAKASSHPLKAGRFYTGTVTSVLSTGKINVKIPELGTSYGPLVPLNTTSATHYAVGDNVKCAFADEFFNELLVFGSTRIKDDVFATQDYSVQRFASTGERDSSTPTPAEGQVVYILDSDELQIYNGTEWITVIDTGNSENITAATLVATSASIGTLTVTSASTLTVLGSATLSSSTTIGNVSSTEIAYLDGVTSAIQTQINTKSPTANPTFTGTVVLPSTTSIGNVTSTEIGYLDGVTSALQTQIDTKSPTANPTFTGTVTIPALSVSGNATITGNLTINGTTTTVNSTTTTVDDPIITLGGDTAPASDDNKDRGIEFRYHSGTAASVGFFGYDDSTESFTFLTGATNSSEVFSGTRGTLDVGATTVRASATQDGIVIAGRSGGTSSYAVTVTPTTLSANRTLTFPDTTGTVVTSGDSGTVTNAMLAGSIANNKLSNSTISGIALGSNLATLTLNVSGTGLSGNTTYNGSAAATFTVTSNATSANTGGAIVARDASGNFSAGTITATLSGTASNVPASGITGQAGMWTSAARPGPYRLYRNDHDSAYNIQATWDGSTYWYLRGYLNDTYHAPCRVGYSESAGNSSTVGGLSVHSGRNNGANQIVRTQENGYILCGYINSDSGYNENNASSPDRVWGSNAGGDSYLRTYRTTSLDCGSVGGNTPQTSGFNGGLAVRYSGDARLDSNYFVGYGTVGVGTGASINLRRRSADGYFLIEGSRAEYKRDIEGIDINTAIDILKSLNPVKFHWKDEFDGPEHDNPLMQEIRQQNKEYGFLVEDVEASSPELVTYLDDNDDKTPTPMMWQQNGVIALLVKTVQNLIARIENLESIGAQ